MKRYIKSYQERDTFDVEVKSAELNVPYVAYIRDEDKLEWFKIKYLTIVPLADGTMNMTRGAAAPNVMVEWSKDGKIWTESSLPLSVDAVVGENIYLRGTNQAYSLGDEDRNSININFTAPFELEGNIMSLLGGREELFPGVEFTFTRLFKGSNVVNATNLFLPASIMNTYCYAGMFMDCQSLISGPILQSQKLASHCFVYMFSGCTALVNAPVLPATTLAEGCYGGMFMGCTAMVNAPALPATKMERACYTSMFTGCTALEVAPTLAALSLAEDCYAGMFEGCTALIDAPALPATNLVTNCYSQMFYGCSSLRNAPVLHAPVLVQGCYQALFNACTSLEAITCLAEDISATGCLAYWTGNMSATGTFTKKVGVNFPSGFNGIPEGWNVVEV
jgi:hypothetical protein